MTFDGPYSIFAWILLANLKVNPVVCWKKNTTKQLESLPLKIEEITKMYDRSSYRFHIQEGGMVLLAGIEASHILS